MKIANALRLAISLLGMLLSLYAFGGTYQAVSATGGTATWDAYLNPNQLGGGPVTTFTYNYTASYGSRGYSLSNYSYPVKSLSFSGPITFTLKWVPTDPDDVYDIAPSQVIAVERTSATIHYGGILNASYTITDGIDTPQSGSGIEKNITLNGLRYSGKSGATITLTCEPKVTLTHSFSGPSNLSEATVSYAVDLIYPDLTLGGVVTDPKTGHGAAIPVGAGMNATVYTRSVFNSINGVLSGTYFDVTNGDACLGFNVASDQSSGHLVPYSSPSDGTTTHWYYYKGATVDGEPTSKMVSAVTGITAGGIATTVTLQRQVMLYGPKLDKSIHALTGTASASVSGIVVTEDSGGIDFGGDIGTNSPYFDFDYDSVQLCNISRYSPPTSVSTGGQYQLDNSYPYGLVPFSDEPQHGHSYLCPSFAAADAFHWSGVCTPHGYSDKIWATCATMDWQWQNTNSPNWTHLAGPGITASAVTFGMVAPLEWTARFGNVN